MGKMDEKIIWTKVDEAPALATYSFLPIVKAFTGAAGVEVENRDISLAGRTIANFPDYLTEEQRLAERRSPLAVPRTPVLQTIRPLWPRRRCRVARSRFSRGPRLPNRRLGLLRGWRSCRGAWVGSCL